MRRQFKGYCTWTTNPQTGINDLGRRKWIVFTNLHAALMIYPIIMPKETKTCHIMTSPPLIDAGAHSAVYTATVAEFAPMPASSEPPSSLERIENHLQTPSSSLDPRNDCHEVETACHADAPTETRDQRKTVPRRPKKWFDGIANQQPVVAHIR